VAISIKNPEVDALARELSEITGESITLAVEKAIKQRLNRVMHPREGMAERLNAIARRAAALPDRDTRSADEIIGYDENGLPT
jgi:antitoxin VapB